MNKWVALAIHTAVSALAIAALLCLIGVNEARADVWLDVSVASYHFQREPKHNERNWGAGLEVGITDDVRAVVGSYRNSIWHTSTYMGVAWLPLHLGPAKVGAVAGVVNGYTLNDGGFFPVVLPTMTLEYKRVGFNLVASPKFQDKPAMVGLQIKALVWP